MTEQQVRFIRDVHRVAMRQRRAAGFQYMPRGMLTRLAQAFGVSRSHIKAIVTRRNWRHLK